MKKLATIVGIGAAACGIALGGAAIASAAGSAPAPTSTSGSAEKGRGGSSDTSVTGAEAAKVVAAVRAKDSAASITTVRKDPDGSYDALGTKSGASVMYDVSTDLKTITLSSGRGHGGGGHHGGGSSDTAVAGSEAAKVVAAVRAKDSAASITTVRQDPDGSYDALGTKSGASVMYDVSTDLKTITQNNGGHGNGSSKSTSSSSASPTGAA